MKRLPLILALILLIGGCSIARKEEPVWFPAKVTRISKDYANINTNIAEPQLSEHVAENRRYWDAMADEWVAAGERGWASENASWGCWRSCDASVKGGGC